MYITYAEYQDFGFNLVPENEFFRFETMAENTVRKHTFGRIEDSDLRGEDGKQLSDKTAVACQLGVCELTDLFYSLENPQIGILKTPLILRNDEYSEHYRDSGYSDIPLSERVTAVLRTYFTQEQLYRGV